MVKTSRMSDLECRVDFQTAEPGCLAYKAQWQPTGLRKQTDVVFPFHFACHSLLMSVFLSHFILPGIVCSCLSF